MTKAWHALVPLKPRGDRKSRLADALSAAAREHLADALAEHVLGVLMRCASIENVTVLGAQPPASQAGTTWRADKRRGLNKELELAAPVAGFPLLIIHADLPLLTEADVTDLLDTAATRGVAIAPDRHGTGTNAIALRSGDRMSLFFGPDSFHRHQAHWPDAAIVTNDGLTHDLDAPADLAALQQFDIPRPLRALLSR